MKILKGRLDFIDSLRGLAATWVVFYHAWNRFYPGLSTQKHPFEGGWDGSVVYPTTFFLFQYGYLGVTAFFVLSGFCIHLPQAKKFRRSGSDELIVGRFAWKRARRLYPAYFASLIFTAVTYCVFPLLLKLTRGSGKSLAEIFSLREIGLNAVFLQHLDDSAWRFNGVYWTLLYEVQFYVLYPLLLLLCRRLGFAAMVGLLLGVEALFASGALPPVMPLFLDHYYEWALGMLAAEWLAAGSSAGARWGRPLAVGFLALAVYATFVPALWPFRYIAASTGFFCSLLDLGNAFRDSEAGREPPILRLLSTPALVFVGIFSYSIYLTHVPTMDFVWTALDLVGKRRPLPEALTLVVGLATIPLCYLVAYPFFRRFEEPFLTESKASPRVEPVGESPASGPEAISAAQA